MICPKCGNRRTRAIHTAQNGGETVRTRRCEECEFSFRTIETPKIVSFSDEEREEYNQYIEDNK